MKIVLILSLLFLAGCTSMSQQTRYVAAPQQFNHCDVVTSRIRLTCTFVYMGVPRKLVDSTLETTSPSLILIPTFQCPNEQEFGRFITNVNVFCGNNT